jgi:hypothetical protein
MTSSPLPAKKKHERRKYRDFPRMQGNSAQEQLGNKKQCDEWCVAGHAGFRTGGVQDAFRSQIWMGQKVHCTLSSERPMSFAG